MLHRFISTIIFAFTCMVAGAQGVCTINGNIQDCSLNNGEKIKKVFLTRTNESGQAVEVATAKVKKGKYTFKYNIAQDEPALLYNITGFGEGKSIEVFVEPGEVVIETESAACPENSIATGTPANDTYAQYKAILFERAKEVADAVAILEKERGKEWLENPEGKREVKRIEAKEGIRTESQILRFLIDHNASPMTPYVVEHVLLPKLTVAYAQQIDKAISTTLHTHPYYLSLHNKVLASDMKVGNELPDITFATMNGETARLSDFRGKYVVLNFWASDCSKSADMIAELQHLQSIVKENLDKVVIVSIALQSDTEAWRTAVSSNNAGGEGWLHACEALAFESSVAKLYKIEKTPRIVLVEPEGRAVSLDMDIDEVVMRIEQILSGDLYYFDQVKE